MKISLLAESPSSIYLSFSKNFVHSLHLHLLHASDDNDMESLLLSEGDKKGCPIIVKKSIQFS